MPTGLSRSHTLRGVRQDLQAVRRRLRSPESAESVPESPPDPAAESRARQEETVRRYLERHDVAKLEIGSGNTVLAGWLGTDLKPRHHDVVQMDATEPFPFPDSCLDFIHAEHLIEHISFKQGQRALAECRRVLKPGGVIRLATPDLERLISVYRGDAGAEGDHYMDWVYSAYMRKAPHKHPVFMLNRQVRSWGHTFIYDPEVLRMALEDAGFVDVEQCELGESRHEALRGVERHHSKGGNPARDRAIRFETMVFEGTNPPGDRPRDR